MLGSSYPNYRVALYDTRYIQASVQYRPLLVASIPGVVYRNAVIFVAARGQFFFYVQIFERICDKCRIIDMFHFKEWGDER